MKKLFLITLLATISTVLFAMICTEAYAANPIGNSIFVTGGRSSTTDNTNLVQVFDGTSWSATTAGTLPIGVDYAPSIAYNGKIYVMGGFLSGGGYTNAVQVYDVSTNTWSTTAAGTLPYPVAYSTAAEYGGKIYVMGGNSGGANFNTIQVYDTATNTWSTTAAAPLPIAVAISATAEYGGKIYVMGGTSNGFGPIVNTVQVYDIATNTWSTTDAGNLPVAMSYVSAAEYNGKIYVMGGWDGSHDLNTVQVYNIATNTWSTTDVGTLPIASHSGSTVAFNGKIYQVGGFVYNSFTFLNTVQVYDPSTNSWSTTSGGTLPYGVGSHSAVVVLPATITLDETSCPTILGSWDSSTNTCTINGPPYGGPPGVYLTQASDELVIPSGTSLAILNPDFNQYYNYGTLTNHGTIQVSDPGSNTGFQNWGTVNNYGIINISNTGYGNAISNYGPFNNYGTITITSSGDPGVHGIDNYAGAMITNSGIITISNASGIGLDNQTPTSTITNSGTITVSNTGGTGIANSGIINENCGATYSGNLPSGNPLNNVSCVIDTTPPVIVPTITGTLGNNGWYTSDVTVSWSVTDPESTISSSTGCTTSIINTDTAGTTLTCTATSAGGTSSNSVTIKRDSTPPVVTIASPVNATIITSSDIAITGTSSDSGSGIVNVKVSIDGSAFSLANGTTSWSFTKHGLANGIHTIFAKAVDNVGNVGVSYNTNAIVGNPIPVGINPKGVIFNSANGDMYVVSTNNISVIDGNPSNGTYNSVIATIPLSVGANSLAFDPLNKYIYVNNQTANTVLVVDGNPSSSSYNTIIGNVPTGSNSNNIGFDSENNNVYVTQGASNQISVIDGNPSSGTYNTVIATIPVGGNNIAVNHANKDIYVSNGGSNNVSVIDGNPSSVAYNTVIATIPVGFGSNHVEFDSQSDTIYVVTSNNVSVIDGNPSSVAYNTVIATIPVGTTPNRDVFDPVNANVYVTNVGSDSISVIDGNSSRATYNTVIATIHSSQPHPHGMDFDPLTDTLYVSNDMSNSVSVVLTPTFFSVNVLQPTSVLLASSQNPSAFGQSVTFSATMSPAVPDGETITFSADGTSIGTGITSGSVATYSTSSLSVATHSITASYPGDANFGPSDNTASPLAQSITLGTTTTQVTPSLNPSQAGQSVTFTAQVSPVSPAAGMPTGTVQFSVNGEDMGAPVTLTPAGTATYSTSSLPIGSNPITATYSGDSNFGPSDNTATPLAQIVNSLTSSITLFPTSGIVGGTVTISGSTFAPSSPISITYNGATLATTPSSITSDVSGMFSATFTVPTSISGANAVQAKDALGDSASATFTVSGALKSSSTTLTSSANPSVFSQPVTFTAKVTSSPGAGTPNGSVRFVIDGINHHATLDATGTASITLHTLSVGTHSVIAQYAGNSHFVSSSSDTLTQTVNQASTATTLTSSANPSAYGQHVTFTSTVSSVAPSTITPTGIVQFTVDSNTFTVSLSGGHAILHLSTLSAGSHSVTAKYSGNSKLVSSSSDTLTQTVNQASTATTLTSSANPSKVGHLVTFTAKIKSVSPAIGVPTGTVQFTIDGTAQSPVIISSTGKATYTISSLSVGLHSVIAQYSGSSNFVSSTSTALTQTVHK
ncbi:MAG: Ig-like domain repeat protein [Thaumarchaeota archaeon]|nr:Ig-like domain repeat protein [Nitrososphaerota archaeon]